MKLSVAAVVAVLAGLGFAKPKFTNSVFVVEEGKPFEITWDDAEGTVTLSLMKGNPARLDFVMDIISDIPAGTTAFTWVPQGLPTDEYAFRITDESGDGPNYTIKWPYTSELVVSSSSAVSSTASSTASSSDVSSSADPSSTIPSSSATASSSVVSSSSTSAASSTTDGTPSETLPADLNAAQRFASPLAFLLVTAAAVALFN